MRFGGFYRLEGLFPLFFEGLNNLLFSQLRCLGWGDQRYKLLCSGSSLPGVAGDTTGKIIQYRFSRRFISTGFLEMETSPAQPLTNQAVAWLAGLLSPLQVHWNISTSLLSGRSGQITQQLLVVWDCFLHHASAQVMHFESLPWLGGGLKDYLVPSPLLHALLIRLHQKKPATPHSH